MSPTRSSMCLPLTSPHLQTPNGFNDHGSVVGTPLRIARHDTYHTTHAARVSSDRLSCLK
jgi:hypothetical protein